MAMKLGELCGLATGVMGWRVDDFWHATPVEFMQSWRAWAKARGIDVDTRPLNQADLDELRSKFPDN